MVFKSLSFVRTLRSCSPEAEENSLLALKTTWKILCIYIFFGKKKESIIRYIFINLIFKKKKNKTL